MNNSDKCMQILFLSALMLVCQCIDVTLRTDCYSSVSLSASDQKVSCGKFVMVQYGDDWSEFNGINCNLPFDIGRTGMSSIETITQNKLSRKDCDLKRNSQARRFLDTVDEITIKIMTNGCKDYCNLKNTRMNETLRIFDQSVRTLKIESDNLNVLNTKEPENLKVDMSEISLTNFKHLEEINLKNVEISGLNKFNAPKRLKNFGLEKAILEPGDHIFPSEVKKIEIKDCEIEAYDRDFFKNVTEVEVITLESLKRRKKLIPGDMFTDLTKLREVILIDNKVEELQDTLFEANSDIELLKVSSESLATIPENLFKNLSLLRYLTISNTKIENLPENLLETSIWITHLTLNFNKIKTIPASFLENSRSITNLILNDNRIETIHNGTFTSLNFCRVLDLSRNKIESIPNNFFDGMISLNKVFLNNNNITELGSAVFLYSRRSVISDISLADNPFGSYQIPGNILEQFKSMTGLKHLDLRNTSLTSVKPAYFLDTIHTIKTIDLSDNQIDILEFYSEFKNAHVYHTYQAYNLTGNYLLCDCSALDFLTFFNALPSHNIEIGKTTCSAPETMLNRRFVDINPLEFTCQSKMCPGKCACYQRPVNGTVVVDCTRQRFINVPKMPFKITMIDNNIPKNIELHIEDNAIREFSNRDPNFNHVDKIFAKNNGLKSLRHLPVNITHLDVRRNHLTQVDQETLAIFKNTRVLYLSENPWNCDCSTVDLIAFVKENVNIVNDFYEIRCNNTGKTFMQVEKTEICYTLESNSNSFVLALTLASFSIGIIGLGIGFYYKYQKMIKIFLYSHGFWFVTEDDIDEDKTYDAFIVFTEQDLQDVETIVTELESGPKPFKCCVHFRDFRAGEFITEQIHNSIFESRRIIVFVSEHFKNSNWAQYEFRFAQMKAIDEKQNRNRIIVIVKGELTEVMTESLDEDLKEFLKQVTFIKFDDKWFWEKLMYSMPHRRGLSYEQNTQSTAV